MRTRFKVFKKTNRAMGDFAAQRGIDKRKRGKRYRQKEFADKQKINGVMFYLYDKGYKDSKDAHNVVKHYIVDMFPDYRFAKVSDACVFVQSDFKKFIEYVAANHDNPFSI